MSEQRNRMRARRCGEKSKRGCVCSQHYFFDADARLNHAREYGPQDQGSDGRRNDPTGGASIHDFSLVVAELFRRGNNQRRTRPGKPGTNPQQPATCPCGNRQMSGCPHDCQRSSISSFEQSESWIPSINNIFSLGMAGWVIVKFIAVRFNGSHSSRMICNLPRIRGRTASCSTQGVRRTRGAAMTTAASRASWRTVIPANAAPIEYPHSATAGQPSLSSQPANARISAIACALQRPRTVVVNPPTVKRFFGCPSRSGSVLADRNRRLTHTAHATITLPATV